MASNGDRQEWRTPPELFSALDDEFHFEIDAAANEDNHLCDIWFGENSLFAQDGLSVLWNG